jgi:hypothetical protein
MGIYLATYIRGAAGEATNSVLAFKAGLTDFNLDRLFLDTHTHMMTAGGHSCEYMQILRSLFCVC